MGRGRSKAKQTKVARDLKYSNQDDQDLYFTAAWAKTLDKSLSKPEALTSPDSHKALQRDGLFINLIKVFPLISTVFGGVPLR